MPNPLLRLRLRGAPARALAAALVLAALGGCNGTTAPAADTVPATITVCETNTATLCATWMRSGAGYVADWAQGSHAQIAITRFDATGIVFVRDDPSGTSTGMHAVYTGTPSGRAVSGGVVTWTMNGQTFSGSWTADW